MAFDFDYSKLRGRIKEICGTQANFSSLLGIGRVSLNKKLNHQVEFTQEEIMNACSVLEIDISEIPVYFFTV